MEVWKEIMMDTFDILFEEIIYKKHPEVSNYNVVKEQKVKKRFSYVITIYVDMNMVDLNLSDDVVIEDYLFIGPEYDYETSGHIYDMLTSNIKNTVSQSVHLIGIKPHICNINVICQF